MLLTLALLRNFSSIIWATGYYKYPNKASSPNVAPAMTGQAEPVCTVGNPNVSNANAAVIVAGQ